MTEPLYEHQIKFLERNPDRYLLCYDMGTGKTRASIEWSKLYPTKTLVVVPKGLIPNWHRELKRWDPKGYMRYEVMSKENFKKFAKVLPKFDAIIIDEAHYFAGYTSQLSKSMLYYIRMQMPARIILLTATPFMRSAFNVMTLGRILGKPWDYPLFRREFFADVRMGHRWIPVQKKDAKTKKLLAAYVAKIGETKTLDECADVPKSQEYVEYFEKTKEQQKAIDSMLSVEPIVRYTREHQITGGQFVPDEYSPAQTIKSNKFDRAIEMAENTDRIIFVCRYNNEVERLTMTIRKANPGRVVEFINGSVAPAERDARLQRCAAEESFVLVVNAACSEGWELPQCETMVFFSHDFSLKNYIQMKGRIQRINDLRPRVYVHLTVTDTVDEGVYKSLINKNDFLMHIYARAHTK